jgi:Surface-adhesin protein E
MRFLVALLLAPSALHAQKKWTDIGTTAAGNHVFVDPKSVKRTGNLVAATVRVVFSTPVKTAKGTWMSSRTTATFDCAAKKLAAKENTYYGDAKETKVVEKKVNAQPGYGVALGGTMGAVAMQYLCTTK